MHRAKGLEFDQVIAISHLKLTDDSEETADRRRLLYVALTRSKRRAGVIFL
jgi:superfamily I DNA/RNA helicase